MANLINMVRQQTAPVSNPVRSAFITPADVLPPCRSPQHSVTYGQPASSLPDILGIGLLHPSLSGHQVPTFTRLLAKSKLGRSMLRPLLRTEIGEVSNRRAWHNADKLTKEVLELYKAPLKVEGWDKALLEVTKAKHDISHQELVQNFLEVRELPALLVTGTLAMLKVRFSIISIWLLHCCTIGGLLVLQCLQHPVTWMQFLAVDAANRMPQQTCAGMAALHM